MAESAIRTEDGAKKVYITQKPYGTHTYFSGYSDSGVELYFNLAAQDTEKYVDVVFTEDVYLKEGFIALDSNVPFGATMSVETYVQGQKVDCFCYKIPITKDQKLQIQGEDTSKILTTYTLRITIYNSPGTNGKDPAAAFRALGWLKVFRNTTV